MGNTKTIQGVERRSLSRRRFLKLASAAVALPWLPLGAGAQGRLGAAVGAAQASPLSVGYVLGSEDLADVARPEWWPALRRAAPEARAFSTTGEELGPLDVVPATSLLGDPRLAVVPVRFAVLGLYPEVDDVTGSTFDVVLTVHFVTGDPALPEVPFHAWGWRDDPAPTTGSPLRFTVPVERDSGLRLELDVREVRRQPSLGVAIGGASPVEGASRVAGAVISRQSWRQETILTVGLESYLPKLQRGVYLLGLEPRLWEQGGELVPGALPSELAPSLVVSVEPLEEE